MSFFFPQTDDASQNLKQAHVRPGSLLLFSFFFLQSRFFFPFIVFCFRSGSLNSFRICFFISFLLFWCHLLSSLFFCGDPLLSSIILWDFCPPPPPLQTTRRGFHPFLQGTRPDPHGRPHCRPLRSGPRGPVIFTLINNCFHFLAT